MKIKGIAVSFVTAMVMIGSVSMVDADEANEVFDGRIGVVVDKVERSDKYPAELAWDRYPAREEGYDCCTIYLTITRVAVGHVFLFASDMALSILLVDTIGQTFSLKCGSFIANLRDVHDIRQSEFVEGSTAILLFEIPLQSIPSILQLPYFFGASWDDYYSPTFSRININLIAADGDVAPLGNRDGIVNIGDALVALRFALGLETPTQEDMAHGDVAPLDTENKPNPDGKITVGDALVILRKALGII